MRRMSIAITFCVGVLLLSGITSGQPRLRERAANDCNISKSFGRFKAVTSESWLLFEDETGTLRAVDYGCHLQRVFNRQ